MSGQVDKIIKTHRIFIASYFAPLLLFGMTEIMMEDNADVRELLDAKDLATREFQMIDVGGGYRKFFVLLFFFIVSQLFLLDLYLI